MRWYSAGTFVALSALLVSGCGVGQGVGTAPSDDLVKAIAEATTTYIVLDLSTGSIVTSTSVPDATTNAEYRDRKMVFRAVEAGTSLQGSGVADFGHQSDEVRRVEEVPRYYLGIFEVTQAQWVRLASTTPWSGIPAGLMSVGDDRPALGISLSAARAAASSAGARLGRGLSLPSDAQWERACRAGSTGAFTWGDGRDEATATLFAQVAETAAGSTGPSAVGSRAANAWGFYDLHGNVWELTTAGNLRGGSWRDSVTQARSANRGPTLDQSSGHALVGLRLVLTP